MTGILGGNRTKSGARLRGSGARSCACAALLCAAAGGAHARPNPPPVLYGGHEFLSVGAPGNRAMLPVERFYNQNPTPVTVQVGAVPHNFRISKTEVTISQWLPFIQTAYPIWQQWGGNVDDPAWMGSAFVGNSSSGIPQYQITTPNPNAPQFAIRTRWRVAALYANWLHAGMPTGPNADLNLLRTGAYDISTFTQNPDGSYNDQIAHSSGAQFWLPTIDEWTKAAYYDPNRYAPGNPGPAWGAGPPGEPGTNPPPPGPGDPPITGETSGYWLYPNKSQDEPIAGPPGVGQWGSRPPGWGSNPAPVGYYPDVQSPWGVLDMLDGVNEWTETVAQLAPQAHNNRNRLVKGREPSNVRNDWFGYSSGPDSGLNGIRIASAVPGTSVILAFVGFSGLVGGRRRRTA